MTALTANAMRQVIRDTRYKGQVSTAAHFLRDIAGAVGKQEAAILFGHKTWKKAVSEANKVFVVHTPAMDFELDTKAAKSDTENSLPPNVIAEVTSRVTTVDKDWDGDIVHPEGLLFMPKGAFLWMHSQASPIGVLAEVVSQNEQAARCKFYVGDVPLGRDAVKLMAIGALKKSIGFKVLEAEPLGFVDAQNGKQVPTGFDIKRAVVLETSAVAIPANPNTQVERLLAKEYDAVRSMASRKELESPILNKWAGAVLDGRTKVFAGVTLESQPDIGKAITDLTEVIKTMKTGNTSETTTAAVELDTKAEIDWETKMMSYGMDDYADGSYEQAQDGVYKSCKKYLCKSADDCTEDHYPQLLATYQNKALCCMRKWTQDGMEKKCYELGYKMDGGKCSITSHKAVKIQPSIVDMAEKRLEQELKQKQLIVKGGGGGTQMDDDAETYRLDEASRGQKNKSHASEAEQLRALLCKAVAGEIETDESLRQLIAGVAVHFEKADQLDGLLGLVEVGA